MFFQWIPCLYACVCVFICFASSPVPEVWSNIFFPWIPCFLDAFVFSNILLATMLSGCVCLCFSHGFMFFGCVYVFICFASYAVFRMCAYMFFHFIPCFLDAFVISCVLLAPLFSKCVSSCFSDGSCVFVHAFVFCIISLARFSFWMCLHHFSNYLYIFVDALVLLCANTCFSNLLLVFCMRSCFDVFC